MSSLPAPAPAKRRWLELGLLVCSLCVLGWYYRWTAAPAAYQVMTGPAEASYYNLLVRGLTKGHLWLDVPDDPILAATPNPYDPALRPAGHGLHDASYFRGKYYLYFGITPVLILFAPFHWLTGAYLNDNYASVLFCLLGLTASWALLHAVRRDCFPRTPLWLHLLSGFALGLANMVPPLLRRASIWEVPITCAYALFMLTLYCLWRALAPGASARRWLFAASTLMGLTIGARPVYLLGAVVLLVPLAWSARAIGRGFYRQAEWRQLAGFALGPIFGVGLLLALYNYQRFGNPLEFGQTYQLSGAVESQLVHFSPRYFLFNLRVYLLSTPGFSPYFPFLTVISLPPLPPGQFGVEDPYGLLPGMPWVLFAGAAGWMALRRGDRLGYWCGGVLLGVLLVMGTLFCFGGATGRYQVDFAPGLVLLGAIGVAGIVASVSQAVPRRLLLMLATGLGLWSIGFNALLSLQHNRLLLLEHPALYARIARGFNFLPFWVSRMADLPSGPVELKLIFPANAVGRLEPLVVTGHEFLADYLYVRYLDPDHVHFGLVHTSRGAWNGPAVRIHPGQEYRLEIQMGSLHPPAAHPFYDGMTAAQIQAYTQEVRVLLDDVTVFFTRVECYDATDWQPTIGERGPHRPAFPDAFSGRLLGWRRVAPLPAQFAAGVYGGLHLSLVLPAFTSPRCEPLLNSGVTGRGDLIYLRYLDARHFAIGHDCWGYGGSESPPVEYEPGQAVDLRLYCPPLLAPGMDARLRITRDDQVLLEVAERFHPSDPASLALGVNLIGASTAEKAFTGVIDVQERLKP